MADELLKTDFDPSARELCPDGACIGVIGSDGRCRECGKRSPGGAPKTAPAASDRKKVADSAPAAPRDVEGDGFDPSLRELCPDGACIGVIGSDGRCKECGQRAPGRPLASGPDDELDGTDDDDPGSPDDPSPADPGDPADDDDADERRVCPDGACIGLIGPDGRCKECGRQAE